MKITALFAGVFCFCLPLAAQVPDPGESQDAEAAREKILKAADQLDLIEGNSEANKSALDGIRTELAQLANDNTALKQQVATLQDSVRKMEDDRAKYREELAAEQAKQRQVLIDEVSQLIASKGGAAPHHVKKEALASQETASTPETLAPPPDAPAAAVPARPKASAEASDAPPPSPDDASAAPETDTPPPKPHKGYSYTVEAGQTLTMICAAYRAEGVPVTVTEVRRANGLTEDSVLKPGQTLFIPKPVK